MSNHGTSTFNAVLRCCVAVALTLAGVAYCPGGNDDISAKLKVNTDVGVAFNDIPQGFFDVLVSLKHPDGWYIVTNAQSSSWVSKSGDTIWDRVSADEETHVWEGCGLSDDCWPGVLFAGNLTKHTKGLGQPPGFNASVADIDIDVDSLGLHSDGPSGHWRPDGSLPEDEAEDTESGGLYLPRAIVTGGLPAQLPAASAYKILNLSLRPKWVGPPNPSAVGTLTFYVDATGVALYRVSDGGQVTGDISVPPEGLSEKFAILTNENFTKAGGIYASFAWDSSLRGGEDTAMDFVRLAPAWTNLFVDTNNDGSIDTSLSPGHEHAYATYVPGVVICKDRAGDGAKLDHLVEMKLSVSPYLTTGSVTLRAGFNGSYAQVWDNPSRTGTPITFGKGKTWNLASQSVPSSLWIDGLGVVDQVALELSYKNTNGKLVCQDQVAAYVTDTISYSPSGRFAYAWEPDRWPEGTPGYLDPGGEAANAVLDKLKDHGWNVTTCRYSDTTPYDDDVGGCTLEHLKNCKNGGVLVVESHGGKGFCAVWRTTEKKIDEWMNPGEPKVSVISSYWGFAAYVPCAWLNANWKPVRDRNKAITFFYTCMGAMSNSTDSAVANAGGRVMLGYQSCPDLDGFVSDASLFLGRMNGSIDNGQKRTAGQAYGKGLLSGFSPGFTMYGNGWTTLNPAPTDVFVHLSDNRKGAGCIIFDTYMNDGISPNLAVKVTSGSVSSRRWVGNGSGSYGISLDYDKTGGGMQQLHAEADNCIDQSNSRKMDGDRHTYASDKDWSF